MDPYKKTRREFTEYALALDVPDSAAPDWREQAEALKDLYRKLAYDPAMAPNIDQTFMTPAASKTKVYFVWDFVGRTISFLSDVPRNLQGMNAAQKEKWTDVLGRSLVAAELILDTQPGMMDMMAGRVDKKVDFSNDILEAARRLQANSKES